MKRTIADLLILTLAVVTCGSSASSREQGAPMDSGGQGAPMEPAQVCAEGACTLIYDAIFFQRYAPVTALDMVNNLPGFNLNDGDSSTRGFGGAAGNVILNGARISAKSESISDILGRIPASDIERIEVIRGQVGGLDLRGENVVANVIRRGNADSGAWNAGLATYQPTGGVYPYADISYSKASALGEATVSLSAYRGRFVTERDEDLLNSDGVLVEDRLERFEADEQGLGGSVNASTEAAGWILNANIGLFDFETDGGELSRRFPMSPGAPPIGLFQGSFESQLYGELGLDAERALGAHWRLKLIGLYRDENYQARGSLVEGPVDGAGQTLTLTETQRLADEWIGRLELDWSGIEGHTIELSGEWTLNTLNSSFDLRELEGGALQRQPVPGAQTEVEEQRFDVLLSDSFRLGEVSIDAALGMEDSTIRQVGGFREDRSFFFWKPSLAMSYSPGGNSQWRLRALRNVGQLDLDDFVSDADLGDVELALGNPQLAPETTTTVDLSYELRGEGIGIGSVTVFHDWIDDVNDLLPLTGNLEVPGNIGAATRAGVRFEGTLPLDKVGLRSGRVDLNGRWQTSSVVDPLTGEDRALSGERRWSASAEVRQDLVDQKLAWGFLLFANSRFPQFGLDELDFAGQRTDMDIFIETRVIDGLIISLTAEDVFRDGEDRDRRVFAGDRSNQPLAFTERREQSRAITWTLEVRGDF